MRGFSAGIGTNLRFASLETEILELESGVEYNRQAPETFPTPSESRRNSLAPGDILKLIFRIQFIDAESGDEVNEVELMWVIVAELLNDCDLGRLDNMPSCLEATADVPLQLGAEGPFRAEHVIAISDSGISEKELRAMLAKRSLVPWRNFDA